MTTPYLRQQNPVLRAELRHQRYVIREGRVGALWIVLAAILVVPALLLSIGYAALVLLEPLFAYEVTAVPLAVNQGIFALLLVVHVSQYGVVTLMTFALAANSIRREKQQHTWGLLRLTAVRPLHIIAGKWWASLRALNGDHVMVMVSRVGLLAVALGWLVPFFARQPQMPTWAYLLAFLPLTVTYALLDAAWSAALGVIAAVPAGAAGTVAGSAAGMIRFFGVLAAGVWFYLVLDTLRTSFYAALWMALGGLVVYVAGIIGTLLVGWWLLR